MKRLVLAIGLLLLPALPVRAADALPDLPLGGVADVFEMMQSFPTVTVTGTVAATQSGTWNITNISGTVSLPTGAATSAKQPALGVAGTPSSDVITVQGATSMTPLKVDGSGVTQPVSGTVSCSNCSGTGVSVNEDVASANADPGTPAYAVRKATPANTSGADGDYEPLQVNGGRLWVDASGVTLTVGSHNVTNAGTFAVQADTELPSAGALADATSNPTVPAVGSFNMCWNGSTWDRCLSATTTEATHDGALTIASTKSTINFARASAAAPTSVSADDDAVALWSLRNGSLVVNLASGGTLLTGTGSSLNVNCTGGCSGGTQFAEDAAHTSGDNGTMALAVRKDTAAALAGTDGDYAPLEVDANGRLHVQCGNCSGSGVSANEDAASASGDPGTPAYTVRQDTIGSTTSADGDYQPLKTNNIGRLYTSTTIDAALPAGSNVIGALTANQSVNVAQINGVTPLMGAGNTGTGSPRVTIATDQTALNGLGIYVEDAAETAAGNLSMAGSVRRDTLASSAGSSGDNATINTTADGAMWVAPAAATNGGASTCYLTSAATTNATNCKASAGNLYGVEVINTTSTIYYLRLYNLAAAPTCSSATGFVRTIPIPHASGAGAGIANFYTVGEAYGTGLGFCLTGGGSSTDNTNAATGVYVTLHYK